MKIKAKIVFSTSQKLCYNELLTIFSAYNPSINKYFIVTFVIISIVFRMILSKLTILNFKNIREASLVFSPKVNCFIGNNGMGKTNLLDAIYYLSFCKSHANSIDSQNMLHDTDFFMLNGKYLIGDTIEEISCGLKLRHKKSFKRDKKEYEKLSEHIGLLPLVLISPDDSSLISGGSEERRKFLDGVISQFNNTYLTNLLNYNNALKQRNALLKSEKPTDTYLFELLEEQMTAYGSIIHEERKKFITDFTSIFQNYYKQIAGKTESISLKYISQHFDRDIFTSLKENRKRDMILGYTSQGVHKDELEMLLGNYPIKREGSQGQNKTYLIALKLAQFEYLKNTHGHSPIILMDDIFDKLDSLRVKQIIEMVSGPNFGQIFITDTNREHLDNLLLQVNKEYLIFTITNGNVS